MLKFKNTEIHPQLPQALATVCPSVSLYSTQVQVLPWWCSFLRQLILLLVLIMFLKTYFLCMGDYLHVCMCTHMCSGIIRGQKRKRTPGTGVTDSLSPYGCCETNLGPQEDWLLDHWAIRPAIAELLKGSLFAPVLLACCGWLMGISAIARSSPSPRLLKRHCF